MVTNGVKSLCSISARRDHTGHLVWVSWYTTEYTSQSLIIDVGVHIYHDPILEGRMTSRDKLRVRS